MILSDRVSSGLPDNLSMGSHAQIMHKALPDGKRLLHYAAKYALRMDTPNSRLRAAREKLFETAVDAAAALGMPASTYIGHENGHRNFPAARAPTYAKKFRVSEEWLLYGKGQVDTLDPLPTEEQLQQMVREVIEAEVTLDTKLSDLPRIVGSGLRVQLEHHLAAGVVARPGAASNVLGIGSRSPEPTTPGAEEESRNS